MGQGRSYQARYSLWHRAVLRAVDQLVEDYKASDDLSKVLFGLGEQYWACALGASRVGDNQAFQAYLRGGLGIWQQITDKTPKTQEAIQSYHLAAESYRLLGDQQRALALYQKVVDTWPDYEYGWVCQHRVIKIYKGLLLRQEVQADVDLIAQVESRLKAEYSKLLELYPTSPPARAVERQPLLRREDSHED